jgi:hypothetical protein
MGELQIMEFINNNLEKIILGMFWGAVGYEIYLINIFG